MSHRSLPMHQPRRAGFSVWAPLLAALAAIALSITLCASASAAGAKKKPKKPPVTATQPAKPATAQQPGPKAAAGDGGMAINAEEGATVIINKNDPRIKRIERKLDERDKVAKALLNEQQRTASLEKENAALKEKINAQREQAIATVVTAAEQPNASADVLAAEAALQNGDSKAAEDLFAKAEQAAATAAVGAEQQRRTKLQEAAKAARYQGSLAFYHDTAKALAAYRRAAQHDPEDLLTWGFVGDLSVRAGDLAAAAHAYEQTLRITRARLQAEPEHTEWQRDLSVSYNKIGDMLVAQGDLPAALTAYRDGLKIAEQLAKKDSGNTGWQRDLSVSYDRIGDMLREQGMRLGGQGGRELLLAAAERYAKVLSAYPAAWAVAAKLEVTQHEGLFEFERAFSLNEQRVRALPQDWSAQADYAEKHFTTGRFNDALAKCTALIDDARVERHVALALRAVRLGALLGLGRANEVSAEFEGIVAALRAQPADFKAGWTFAGSKHFVETDGRFAAHRERLMQLFSALEQGGTEEILAQLQRMDTSAWDAARASNK